MCNGRSLNPYRGLILVAILALSGWREASAGLYTMEQTLADFTFDDASLIYGRDSHAPGKADESAGDDRPDALSSMGPTAQSYGTGDGLRGVMTLHSGQGIENDLVRGRFNVFGSLPRAASHGNAALLTDTLDNMDGAKKTGGDPTFWYQKDRMTGSLATKYRGYGIYFSVAGLDEVTWINAMGKAIAQGGDVIELSSMEDTTPAGSGSAIPTPGTLPLLLLGGLAAAAASGRRIHSRSPDSVFRAVNCGWNRADLARSVASSQ